MAKKIKFPLEMANGVQVRTLEELREHFNMEKILGYYVDGKLLTWLNDRYYENEVAQINELDKDMTNFKSKLCAILGVESNLDDEIDIEVVERKNSKIAKLKQFTDNNEFLKNVDYVAFDQEELAFLLDERISKIYLCSGSFVIPLSKENMRYIGINSVIVTINSNVLVDFDSKNIKFEDIKFDDNYCKILSATKQKINNDLLPNQNSFAEKLNKIIEKYKSHKLEKETLAFYSDYELNTDYDSSYRFSSKSDAREAGRNRLNRMYEDCTYYLSKKYGGCLSEKLGWLYAEQISKILLKLKSEVLDLYKEYGKGCPAVNIVGNANEKTMGCGENAYFINLSFSSEEEFDKQRIMWNIRNGIDNNIMGTKFSHLNHLVSKSSIEVTIDKGFEEYCYDIDTTKLANSLESTVDMLTQCVYEDDFIHHYFGTFKESFFRDFEAKIVKGKA